MRESGRRFRHQGHGRRVGWFESENLAAQQAEDEGERGMKREICRCPPLRVVDGPKGGEVGDWVFWARGCDLPVAS